MEPKPTNNKASNSVSHEVFDDHLLEKIVQEFNDFQGRMSEKSCPAAIKMDDLIDMYIINSGKMNANSPMDLNKPEIVLPPHQVQSAQVQSPHGFNIHTENQDSETMINFFTESEDTSQDDTGYFPNSSPTVNTFGAGCSDSRVMHIRYGDLKSTGVADHVIGSVFGCSAETVFQSVMKSFRFPRAGGKDLRKQVGVKENGNRATGRKNIKRKYKHIIETEEEAARRME